MAIAVRRPLLQVPVYMAMMVRWTALQGAELPQSGDSSTAQDRLPTTSSLVLSQCPVNMFPYQFGRMTGFFPQCFDHAGVVRCIAECDGQVAQPALMADSTDG